MKITKDTYGQPMLEITDDSDDVLKVKELTDGVMVSVDGCCHTFVVLDKREIAQLARALAHFAEHGELPEAGGDREWPTRPVLKVGDGGDPPSLQDQITELKAVVANDDWHTQRQFKQANERLDQLTKDVKALARHSIESNSYAEKHITRLKSQVAALKKDLEAHDE